LTIDIPSNGQALKLQISFLSRREKKGPGLPGPEDWKFCEM